MEGTEPAAPAAPAETPVAATPAPAAPAEAPENNAAAAEAALDQDLAKVWDKAHDEPDEDAPAIARAPDGKFAPKNPAAPEQAAAETADPSKPPAPVAQAIEAPTWWSAELQATFAKLPPDVAKSITAAALHDRQNISKLGTALQQYEPLNRVFQEHRAEFEAAGVHPFDGIKQLLVAQQKLMNPATRAEAYKYLLQNYPADLGQAMDGLPPDPQLTALEQRLQSTEARLRQYEAQEQQAQARSQEERTNAVMREIDQAEKSLPDFATLLPEIRLMIPVVQQDNPGKPYAELLRIAHERAGWANPTVRAKWQQAAITEKMQEAAKQAEKAKRVNGLNVSSKQKPSTPGDIDSLLGSVWDKRHNAA